jgi:hypothetical protein
MNTPNTKSITAEHLNQIAERIKDVPPPAAPLTLADAVRKLAPTIAKLRRSGHTFDSISAILHAEGMQVKSQALSRMLRQSKSKQRSPSAAK